MKIAGVIAEYNPFHNGHKYLLDQIRLRTGCDYIIVVLSGNFTQRGAPAVMDKYLRTRMALLNGADVVLELPVCYACASAPYFAQGAVALLSALGVTDVLCFGSECGDASLLLKAAAVLAKEPPVFQDMLRSCIKRGLSFPQARTLALEKCLHSIPNLQNLLSSPNNLLGIEYCKALITQDSPVRPFTIKRKGGGYLDSSLCEANSSALAIRTAIRDAETSGTGYRQPDMEALKTVQGQVPESVFEILAEEFTKTWPVFPDSISLPLVHQLLLHTASGYTSYFDVSGELSDRIRNQLSSFHSFTSFCGLLKTKELTYSRISRSLLHIYLGITEESVAMYRENGTIFYARILGFRTSSAELLSAVKKQASIPLISKLADSCRTLKGPGLTQLKDDIRAAHMYNALVCQRFGVSLPEECKRQIVRV